jgi:hypothetical protein
MTAKQAAALVPKVIGDRRGDRPFDRHGAAAAAQVEKILAETTEAGDRPAMPSERTFYRLVQRLASAGTPSAPPAPAARWPSSRTARSARLPRPGRVSGRRSIPPRWTCGWCTMTGLSTGSS